MNLSVLLHCNVFPPGDNGTYVQEDPISNEEIDDFQDMAGHFCQKWLNFLSQPGMTTTSTCWHQDTLRSTSIGTETCMCTQIRDGRHSMAWLNKCNVVVQWSCRSIRETFQTTWNRLLVSETASIYEINNGRAVVEIPGQIRETIWNLLQKI